MTAKKNRHSPSYPLGTLAAYGPDNTRATKLVASVFTKPGQENPVALDRWIVEGGDIRQVPSITKEVGEFFQRHGVRQTTAGEKIMGCPHEEGIDYPMGRKCPRCPSWHDIDRLTHEPIRPPTPAHTVEEVLEELSLEDSQKQPVAALESADAHREALVEPLLEAMEKGIANPVELPAGEAMLFSYATYLLAKWREPRACPLMLRWLSLPEEEAFDLGGYTVTDAGNRLLASVYDGNSEPIMRLIRDRGANEYCRGQALEAWARLANWGEVSRDTVIEIYRELLDTGLEREHSHVWDNLASSCADMEAVELFPELRKAYEKGLIDPTFIHPSELDEIEAGPRGKWVEIDRERNSPIMDVAAETAWWQCFSSNFQSGPKLGQPDPLPMPSGPVPVNPPVSVNLPVRAEPKIGRNEPCPCGSGKKYKKCCGK